MRHREAYGFYTMEAFVQSRLIAKAKKKEIVEALMGLGMSKEAATRIHNQALKRWVAKCQRLAEARYRKEEIRLSGQPASSFVG